MIQQARHAIDAQIEFIQIRERDLEASELASIVEAIVALARGSGTRILVNDRTDVALASGAAGVHLRADSAPPAAVRSMAPPHFVIGRSVHTVAEAIAVASDVDYLIAGTVWPTGSKSVDRAMLGVDGLTAIARAVEVPVLAIGGVALTRIREVAATGAAGVAAISLFMGSARDAGGTACRAVPLGPLAAAVRAQFDTSPAPS